MNENTINLNSITTVEAMLEVLNTAVKNKSGVTPAMLEHSDKVCKSVNAKTLMERCNALLDLYELDPVSMWEEFTPNQFVPTVRISLSKKDGVYKRSEGKRQVSVLDIEAALQLRHGTAKADGSIEPDTSKTIMVSKRYMGVLAHVLHNFAHHIAGMLSEGGPDNKCVVKCPVWHGGVYECREFNMTGCSIKALSYQLDCLLKSMLPMEVFVNMKRADVEALKLAITQEKNMEFTLRNERVFLNKFMLAYQVRRENRAYKLESKAKIHQQPNAKGPEEALVLSKC